MRVFCHGLVHSDFAHDTRIMASPPQTRYYSADVRSCRNVVIRSAVLGTTDRGRGPPAVFSGTRAGARRAVVATPCSGEHSRTWCGDRSRHTVHHAVVASGRPVRHLRSQSAFRSTDRGIYSCKRADAFIRPLGSRQIVESTDSECSRSSPVRLHHLRFTVFCVCFSSGPRNLLAAPTTGPSQLCLQLFRVLGGSGTR